MKINQIKDIEVKKEGDNYSVIIDLNKCKYLYRYRAYNELTLGAFEKDQVWMSSPLKFNDPYDVSLAYSKKGIKDYIKKKVIDLSKITKFNERQLFWFIYNQMDKMTEALINKLRSTYHIACFCTNIHDEIMWAHYADCGKGFALKYDIDDFYKQKLRDFKNIFPVVYTQNKANASIFIKSVVDKICYDLCKKHANSHEMSIIDIPKDDWAQISLQSLILKKKSWKYENEYRLVADNSNPESFYRCYEGIKPIAIYLGESMPDSEKIKLIELAAGKRIDVYVMKSNYSKNYLESLKLKIEREENREYQRVISKELASKI
ncbi:MAG: DUF2971 domain-containing protein [Treponema sp.]|nr:DUF2971 domain-containing protein [Treponema sp.]